MQNFGVSYLLVLIFLIAPCALFADEPVDFNTQIRPLFSNRCFACHGPDEEERAADLRLDTKEGALEWAVVPGDPDDSEVYSRITSDDEDLIMPPPGKGDPFTKEESALIARWIREGANYSRHWSYVKPVRPDVPDGKHPVDYFVEQGLAEEGLKFSPETDRRTLARRVALDLTGLPPSPEEVDTFVADKDPNAYPNYVDQLLARDSFGEHWARMWLDLARYADSAGYADDVPRKIWLYRDYVIRSFNENKPFNQFTTEQLAGDLMKEPSEAQLIATAFHRNTQTNNEGGTNDEEFRNVAVVDRVNTTFATWMGTTMACAQCHTHKYDPITQEEYYQVFAILNQTQDSDKRDERPILSKFTKQQEDEKAKLKSQIKALERKLAVREKDSEFLASFSKWENGLNSTHWQVLKPTDPIAVSGADLAVEDDHSIFASGATAETDKYTFKATSPVEKITAVKVELLTDKRLPGSGPARDKNLVLNELKLTSQPDGNAKAKRGRFVRLELSGKNRFLHVREVQTFSDGANVALKGTATQSTTGFGGLANVAIDGDHKSNSFSHTAKDDPSPWWEVDLGSEHNISHVVVWNRTGSGLPSRLDGFRLVLRDAARPTVFEETFPKAPERQLEIRLDGVQSARFDTASASYEQPQFESSKAIDGDASKDSGWSIAGGQGRKHQAIFQLENPLLANELSLELDQTYPNHPIGRFRVSVTDAAKPNTALPETIAKIVAKPESDRDETDQRKLRRYFAEHGPQSREIAKEIAKLREKLEAIQPEATVPILQEVAEANKRKTHIHLRGSYLSHGAEVQAGFPVSLAPDPEIDAPDRMTLANWLLSDENPLTARVVANRYWEKLFGVGIVATSEEFGSQGELPSHPELLDWLAVEFKESNWDTKALLKQMVTSRAYRQTSNVSKELAARDPANRLIARGPRVRLSAEMVRDQALAVAGLLSPKMYGPPVRPPQPDMGLKAAFGSGIDWETSKGEDRFRRGIYTTWRRSNPYPSMVTFDAPNREVCTVRRDRTNTPLQALVTLNDPVYIEAAQSLARKMALAGESADEKIRHGFKRCVSRLPNESETKRLVQFYEQARNRYAKDRTLAKKMATGPIGEAPEGSDVVELAALTLTANVLLNLDEMLMKR